MAISDNYTPNSSLGNGVTTEFSGVWTPISEDYFRLYLESVSTGVQTLKTLGSDYTLEFDDDGYTATMMVAPSSSYKVVRARDIAQDQTSPYSTSRGYQGTVHEQSFDKLTAIGQDMQDQVNRSPKYPLASGKTGTFPLPTDECTIVFDGTDGDFKLGPTTSEISNAQGYAEAAEDAKDESVAAKDESVAAKTAAEAALDAFTDIYLGTKATDPSVDNDGNALQTGAQYWNSTISAMKVYNGTSWEVTTITGMISARDYDAVGDGIADDTAELQAALTAAAGKILYIPAGTYKITSGLTIPINTWILGYGATLSGTNGNYKLLTGTAAGGILGLGLVGPGNSTYNDGSHAIYYSGTNNAPSAPTYINGPTIQDCKISDFAAWGILLRYTNNSIVERNRISNIGYAGIAGLSCSRMKADHNIVDTVTSSGAADWYGIFIDRSEGTETADPRSKLCSISHNIVKDVTSWEGIDTHGGEDFVIHGNVITGCLNGISVVSSDISGVESLGPKRVAITGNIIQGSNGAPAIRVKGAPIENGEDIIVANNVITNGGIPNDTNEGSIKAFNVSRVAIMGNTVKTPYMYGVHLVGGIDGGIVTGNLIIDPRDNTHTTPACVRVGSNNVEAAIYSNTFMYQNSGAGTYVAVYSISIATTLTGLALAIGENMLLNNDSTHLTFNQGTTTGVVGSVVQKRITIAQDGLRVYDIDSSHTMTIQFNSDLTGNRSFTFLTGDASRIVDVSAADVTISAQGAALLDDTSFSAMRTTLGLVIGTDVQPYDADLAAIAALSSVADKMPYATGAQTWSLADLTAAGRAILDDANASAQRTTLGLGAAATMTAASQSDQETATSSTAAVTPSVQQYHPSSAKAWLKCNAAGAIASSYNVTSITDGGVGILTVTWNVDFSSVDYVPLGIARSGNENFLSASTQAVGTQDFLCWDSNGATLADPTAFAICAFGDQ